MRVALVSTHRADRGHYAPLRRVLGVDDRFELVPDSTPILPDADVAVVLGDRFEMLQRAMVYVEDRVPLVHIHGGEHTYGSLDERWRWGISAIADAHCVATEDAALELHEAMNWERLGTVHVTGAPGLDGITDRKPWPYKVDVVAHYNPAIDEETTRREWDAIVKAMEQLEVKSYIIKPNGDRFSEVIRHDGLALEFKPDEYRDLIAAAHVIVGNSSAGIIEAPSLGTWTVNVGLRQDGRPRAASVVDVPADAGQIRGAIETFLGASKRASGPNPYGDGHASERIRDVLLGMEMGK